MRIEKVAIGSFGPFGKGELELAEGFTLIYGGNETGKSTWHAALYAAVCGVRRGRGRLKLDDQGFADLHKPWDAPGWTVGCVIRLDDGRRVELRQDLEGKVDCRATDLDLGTDLSSQIIYEGSPDASRWLGLDRRSFAATACVGQADILGLLADPDALQEHIQRAAATAGTDETAAAALDLLDEFASNQVGLDRANSTKPLRRCKTELAEAHGLVALAHERHEEYLSLVAQANDLRGIEVRSTLSLRAAECVVAEQDAASARERLKEAEALQSQFHDGPPADLDSDDAIAQACAAALANWEARPAETLHEGPSVDALESQLASLPVRPSGDLSPGPDVVDAYNRFNTELAGLEAYRQAAPLQLTASVVNSTPDQLAELAHALELGPTGSSSPGPPGGEAVEPFTPKSRTTAILSIGLVIVGAVLAIVLILVGQPLVGGALALAAIAGGVVLWTRSSALALPRPSEAAAGRNAAGRQRYEQAMAYAAHLGIDQTPQAVRAALAALLQANQARDALVLWELQHTERQGRAKAAEDNLRAALAAHGGAQGEPRDPTVAYVAYAAACRERQTLANQAGRREDLTNQLNATLAAASVASATRETRARASDQIRIAAQRCGVKAADDEALVSTLRAWREARTADLAVRAERGRAWARLQALLGPSGSVENLTREVERLNHAATLASAGVSDEDRVKISLGDDAAAALNLLRQQHASSLEQAAGVQGQADERAKALLSVPEAEERLARAEAALAKVTSLEETLRQTREFLSAAQDRVHRDIAPILAKAVRDFLEQATAGRYSDVIVDPATLNVKVCGQQRQWREARLLSHGTREQVYLLLRMALADHLSTPGERCPLILDDVTVHSDDARKEAMLTLLVQHASQRQVVLFSQEAAVLNWCQANATGPSNAVRLLEAPVGT